MAFVFSLRRKCVWSTFFPWPLVLYTWNSASKSETKTMNQIKSVGQIQRYCWAPETMSNKNRGGMGVKERKGTGKTKLSPGVTWKCQAWENWLFPWGVYFTRWEISQRRLDKLKECQLRKSRREKPDLQTLRIYHWNIKSDPTGIVICLYCNKAGHICRIHKILKDVVT